MSPVDLKKSTYTELVAFTNEELDARMRDLKDDLLTQNIGLATNTANDFGRRSSIKRAIARCLMIKRKRELEQLPTPSALITKQPKPEKPTKPVKTVKTVKPTKPVKTEKTTKPAKTVKTTKPAKPKEEKEKRGKKK
jgi:ribosomal protein L29